MSASRARVPFGKRRGLASEHIEPIAQRAARPFHMHRPGWSSAESQRGPDLLRQEAPMLITRLDALRQRHGLGTYPRRAPALARPYPLTIGSHTYGCLPMPAIAEPGEG